MIKLKQILEERQIRILVDDISKSIDRYNLLIESSNINEANTLVDHIISKISQLFLKMVSALKRFKNMSDKIVFHILSIGDKIVSFMAKFKSKYPNLYSTIKILVVIIIILSIFMLLSANAQAATGDGNEQVEKVLNSAIAYLHDFSKSIRVDEPDYMDKSGLLNRAIQLLDFTKDTLQSGDTVQGISTEMKNAFTEYNEYAYKIADSAMNTMNDEPEKFSKFIQVWDNLKSLMINSSIIK